MPQERGRIHHAVRFKFCHERPDAIWDAYGEYPDGEKNDAEEFIFVLTSFINFLVRVYVEFEYAKLNSVESRNSKSVVL